MWVLSPNSATSLFAFIEWNKGFSNSISKKTFSLWQITEKNTNKALFQQKIQLAFFCVCFFFSPTLSGKAEQQSRCTGEKHICWLCTMERKVHFVLLPFQATYKLQLGSKKKKN